MSSAMLAVQFSPTSSPPNFSARRSRQTRALVTPPAFAQFAGLGVLAASIVIHEAGHFGAARSMGIRIKEFSVGFGPTVLQLPARFEGGPRYALRALPLGGYVSFPRYINASRLEEAGVPIEDELAADVAIPKDDPNLLENRPLRQQALVIVAGVAANLVLAWACLFTSAVGVGVPTVAEQQVILSRVLPSSPAERLGLRVGDRLLALDGRPVGTQTGAASALSLEESAQTIRSSMVARRSLSATLERSGRSFSVSLLPPAEATPPVVGVELYSRVLRVERIRLHTMQGAQRAAQVGRAPEAAR